MSAACVMRSGIYAGLAAFALSAPAAIAQVSAPVGSVAPTREQIDRPELKTRDEDQIERRLVIQGGFERAPCPLDEPRYRDIQVTVSDVSFEGLKGLPPETLRSSYAAFEGGTHSISVLCTIRDSATSILRNAGYLAAIQIPPQRIENGIVRFDVLMGRLVSVHVRGDAGPGEKMLATYLERIRDQEVFNSAQAERYLLAMRDFPGYDVRLVLKPAGTGPGELIGELFVERRAFDLDANIQNYGSKAIGRFGGLVRANIYGLTGLADRTSISVFSTSDFEEQQVYQLSHDFLLGTNGFGLGARAAYAVTRPDIGDMSADVKAKTFLGTLEASQRLIASQKGELKIAGGLELVNQNVKFGPALLSRDRLRVLFARMDYGAMDSRSLSRGGPFSPVEPRWRAFASLELRKGVSFFGASKGCGSGGAFCPPGIVPPSNIEGDPEAFVMRFRASAEYRPVPGFAIAIAPRFQYSPDALFAFEEFSVGNYTVGRGYDPGSLTGDSGAGISAEFRLGTLVPQDAKKLALQPFVFVDAAKVWNEDDSFLSPGDEGLISVGGGVRAAWGRNMRADLTVAVPTERIGPDRRKGDVRVLFSVTARLMPWRR